MYYRLFMLLGLIVSLGACVSEVPTGQANTTVTGSKPAPGTKPSAGEGRSSSRGVPPELIPASERATPTYYAIAQRIEPAARRHCRAAGLPNCNFTFLADIALGRPSNAWHTRDGTRPIVIVSLPFFEEVENVDQLAFVLGHEVAHHILNHNPRGQVDIQTSALTEALDAHRTGGNVEEAHQRGAVAGHLQYSQEYELEADALGARIAWESGFDPAAGAAYFARRLNVPSPVHSTHPPNAARLAAVRRVIAGF